jgi:hypothetical protein
VRRPDGSEAKIAANDRAGLERMARYLRSSDLNRDRQVEVLMVNGIE